MTPDFSVRLHELQAGLGGELVADASVPEPGERLIRRIGPLQGADAGTISFLANPRYRAQLADTDAGCVIVSAATRDAVRPGCVALVVPDPYLHFARLTQWWAARTRPVAPAGIHPSAVVASDVVLGEGVSVGAQAVIESGAVIGDGAVIGPLGFVGAGVRVGERTRLAPRVTLMPGTRIGARCLLHSGVVLGADGFGFAPDQGRWEKIEQLGGVVIGDDVEIGANTCIDRGALDDTLIGAGVKLDNLIQIGHNVRIGEHTAMAGCTGVAGSTRIGRGCAIGGGANILGHLEIADGVTVSATSVVTHSLRKPGHYSGIFPIDDNASWERNAATLRQLHSLRDRIRALEKQSKTS